MTLVEYFKEIYKKPLRNWNVESSLNYFGSGESNEGSSEGDAIKRYYVKPNDTRFKQIFLNFDDNRNIESIVWFFDEEKSELLSLAELKKLFGSFITHNVIYDETTELTFVPNENTSVNYIRTDILEWVEKREDGSMYFQKENKIVDVTDDYKVSSLIFKIK